ncbi:unnamed protein product [Gordionus sp. m RMFG-2023]
MSQSQPNNNLEIIADEAELKSYINKVMNQQPISEFLYKLNDYTPLIPDAVSTYFLQKSGFEIDDIRLIRLISLAAQKFVTDLANDALQHNKMRLSNLTLTGNNKHSSLSPLGKYTLTTDDLASAASEYGIHIKKPPYFY